jgi:microcystin-dependent protein
MDCYIGMIFPWAANYAPENFLFCAGQTLPIASYQALYAVIGVTYGGDGRTNFMLPNLCGRVPVGVGTAPQLPTITLGQTGGQSSLALSVSNLPPHNHAATFRPSAPPTVNATLQAGSSTGTTTTPAGNFLTNVADGMNQTDAIYASKASAGTLGAIGGLSASLSGSITGTVATANTGSGVPIQVAPPFLGINYIICTIGLFPSRP